MLKHAKTKHSDPIQPPFTETKIAKKGLPQKIETQNGGSPNNPKYFSKSQPRNISFKVNLATHNTTHVAKHANEATRP